MSSPASPCKDCKARHIGCHSKCQAYKEFKEERDTWRKNMLHHKDIEYGIIDIHKTTEGKKS